MTKPFFYSQIIAYLTGHHAHSLTPGPSALIEPPCTLVDVYVTSRDPLPLSSPHSNLGICVCLLGLPHDVPFATEDLVCA